MTEVIKPVANESSDDRNPWDSLSPQADASNNAFETNPNDSVDITAEYNDDKALSLEEQLKGTDFELSPDAGEEQELVISPSDYEDFANNYLAELFSALENPVNADDANQEAINDQITIAVNLFSMFQDNDPNKPSEVFQTIADAYSHTAEVALSNRQTQKAEADQRRANAVSRMKDSFDSYITEHNARRRNAEAESHEDTVNGPSLPGDVIS